MPTGPCAQGALRLQEYLRTSQIEVVVYKHVSIERVDVLANGKICFTQPDALNDSFESMPSLTLIKQEQIQAALSHNPPLMDACMKRIW
jgi:hypothetical protein